VLLTTRESNHATMTDLIIKSGVRDSVEEYNVASDFYEALDEEVADILDDAAERAEANGRNTVQQKDL
jgi:histone H3/H4